MSDGRRGRRRSTGLSSGVVILAIAIAAITDGVAQELTAEQRFARGKQLISANCGDCTGSAKIDLERGLADVQAAIDAGYRDRAEALGVLAEGLNTLQFVFTTPDSSEQRQIAERKRSIYRELIKIRPKDADALYAYATSLEGDVAQIAAYRDVLAVSPRHAGARFALGMLLLRNGRTSEGVEELKQVVETADARQLETYGREISQALRGAGRNTDADEIEKVVRRRLSKVAAADFEARYVEHATGLS